MRTHAASSSKNPQSPGRIEKIGSTGSAGADRAQTGIGAGIGCIALGAAALYNAHLVHRRDDRLRDQEVLDLASELHAEIVELVAEIVNTRILADRLRTELKEGPESTRITQVMRILRPPAVRRRRSPVSLFMAVGRFAARQVPTFHTQPEATGEQLRFRVFCW